MNRSIQVNFVVHPQHEPDKGKLMSLVILPEEKHEELAQRLKQLADQAIAQAALVRVLE